MEKKLKKNMWLRHRLNDPFVFILIIPFFLLDAFIELYHQIGFSLCGIPKVKRSEYIKVDRHKLKYLNFLDKIGCVYCGYTNGFLRYASEIAGRTEKYWCGIKHQGMEGFKEPRHHENFTEYGNEEDYKNKYLKF